MHGHGEVADSNRGGNWRSGCGSPVADLGGGSRSRCAPACVTSVILVLSVERSKRVEAIKALPPVVAALNQPAIDRLRAMERGRNNGMRDDMNVTNRS